MSIASISSHKRVLTETTDRILSRMKTATGATDISVELVDGLQTGITRQLKLSSMNIGARMGSDITLIDEDVAELHSTVIVEKSAFGLLAQVEAVGGDVVVDGTLLERGEVLSAVKVPFTLQVGSAKMRFRRPNQQSQASAALGAVFGGRPLGMDPIIFGGIACLFALLFGGLIWSLLNRNNGYVVDFNVPAVTEEAALKSDNDWLLELRQQIASVGLEEVLSVDLIADRIIQARGQIPSSKVAVYRDLQAWADTQVNAPSILWDAQQRPKLISMPNIGMVRFSNPPALILSSGVVIPVGEEVIDGWLLSEVDNKKITLKRGFETQIVEYRVTLE